MSIVQRALQPETIIRIIPEMKITKPLKTLKNYLCRPSDKRGKRMVFVIECILNQNSRDIGAANYKAMNFKVIKLCMKYHVGMVQIPCPEMICLGFGRERKPGQSPSGVFWILNPVGVAVQI